jgi:hypothetical protein
MQGASRDSPEKRKYYMHFLIFTKVKNVCPLQGTPMKAGSSAGTPTMPHGFSIPRRILSVVFIEQDILRVHIYQLLRIRKFHPQPYPAFAHPENFAWNSLHSAANHERALPGIEPDHAIAGFHDTQT